MTDHATAVRERDAGIAAATAHAEDVVPTWSAVALAYLISYARDHQEFISEQVSEYARSRGFSEPSARAWGGVFIAAAKRGIIKQCGVGRSLRRHNSICPKWQSQIYWSVE